MQKNRGMKVFKIFLPVLLLGACTQKPKVVFDKTVHVVLPEEIKGFDPVMTNDTVSSQVLANIYDSPLSYDYEKRPFVLTPQLLEELPSLSADKKILTFLFKQGVYFQDADCFSGGKGRELTAEDFVYSIKRIADARIKSVNWFSYAGSIEGLDEFRRYTEKLPETSSVDYGKSVGGILAKDKYTAVVKLTRPNPLILYNFAHHSSSLVPKECVEKYGNDFNFRPVGTGPYSLVSEKRGKEIILQANPKYHQVGFPKNLGAVFHIVKEADERFAGFMNGDFDYLFVEKDQYETLIENGELRPQYRVQGMTLEKQPQQSIYYIQFNMKDPVLGGVEGRPLRRAIAYAFDRAEFQRVIRNNRDVLADSLVPPGIDGYEKNPYPFERNLEKAHQELKKYKKTPLPTLVWETRSADTTARQIAELVQKQLREVGIAVEVRTNAFPEMLEREKTGQFQFSVGAWQADYPDAENFLQLLTKKSLPPGPNASSFVSPEFERLYEKMRMQEVGPERTRMISRMGDIIFEEVPWILNYYPVTYQVAHPWIKNLLINDLVFAQLKYLDVDILEKTTRIKQIKR